MTSQEFATLAYTKSPKASKRTTFQDELQAAVSARASQTKADQYSYSDDFDEDEDDFLNLLLKSRKKRTDAFRAGRTKTKVNFDLSDDEDTHGKTKKVSFLKSQRIKLPPEEASDSRENEPPDTGHDDNKDLFSSQDSTRVSDHSLPSKSVAEPVDPQILRESSRNSLSHQTSDGTLLDTPLPLPRDSSVTETPGSEEKTSHQSQPDLKPVSSAEGAMETEAPRPKPRQRTRGLTFHTTEMEGCEPQDLSRPQTSSASSTAAVRSVSPHLTEDDHSVSHSLSKSSSNKSEQSQVSTNTKATGDSGSGADLLSNDGNSAFQTNNENMRHHSDSTVTQLLDTQEKSFDTKTSSSHLKGTRRCQSACSGKVESKYLGSLKFLDCKVSLQESETQAAGSLRAAIYQDWLQQKKQKLREKLELKKKEEFLQEKKKKDEETKKEDAFASYEAWKKRKREKLRAKAKEKEEMVKKEQQASEEKEEKRHSAKQVFDKWKEDTDRLLKEKQRKQKDTQNKQELQKQQREEERKRESTSAFSNWCEKKTDVISEKVKMERREIKSKTEEERYIKEEKEKTALEMYEIWLARKELEHRRETTERRIKAILQDSPPPPWSPPNKTVGFRK